MKWIILFVAFAHAQTEKIPTLSYAEMKKSPAQYAHDMAAIERTHTETNPGKFIVDGKEYYGSYYKSGENTNVFKVYKNGEVTALRLPKLSSKLEICNQYVEAMRGVQSHGIKIADIVDAGAPNRLAVETKFLKDFQTFGDVLREASKAPNDPIVRQKIEAIKEFSRTYGMKSMPDLNPENIGLKLKDSKYEVYAIDALKETKGLDDFKNVSQGESTMGKIFQELTEETISRRGKRINAMNPTGSSPVKQYTYYNLQAIEREIMGAAYPPKEAVVEVKTPTIKPNSICMEEGISPANQTKLGATRVLGNTLNAFSLFGLALAIAVPETNPFNNGTDLGVPCDRANKLKERLYCSWDSKINPFNDIAYCWRITSVDKLFKKKDDVELCEITFDALGFKVEGSDSKGALKNAGYFDRKGGVPPGKTGKEILDNLSKKMKFSESILTEKVKVPGNLQDFI